MRNLYIILFLNILKLCVSVENIWHSYQYNPIHQNREEIVITNITTDTIFKQDFIVNEWKSLCVEKICYAIGLMEQNLLVTSFKLNSTKNGFVQKSYKIDCDHKPLDFTIFQNWNISSQNLEIILTVVTQKPEMLWYKIEETKYVKFWNWTNTKNITHVNVFQINYNYQLLIISKYLSKISADLYEFELQKQNFWLRQKIELSETTTSTFISTGPNNYLVFPQKSLNLIRIYKFTKNHFQLFKNLTSQNVDHVISFKVGQKSFLAFNGVNTGIYRFTKKDLVKENIIESHLDNVNYWLPISLTVYGDDTILLAQRSLKIGLHQSFDIELFVYNGDKFEEHEDIPCFYFGEKTLGLSCLPDVEAHVGVQGSTSIFLDNILGILVPRKKRATELFVVKFQVENNPNPLEKQINDFVARRQYIDGLIKQQEENYQDLKMRHSLDPITIKSQLDEIEEDIEKLKNYDQKSITYETVIFNNFVKIQNNGIFDRVIAENINNEPADFLLQNIILKNNLKPIETEKKFTNLEVENLFVKKEINGINTQDLLFSTDSEGFAINGNVQITQPITISQNLNSSEINGLRFEEEIIDFQTPVDSLSFENLEILDDISVKKINSRYLPTDTNREDFTPERVDYDNLYIPNHIQVNKINGEDFEEFLKQLCLKNIRNYIPGIVKINGDVTVSEDVFVDNLNNLEFPNEYVFVNSFSNITGYKNFSNVLTSSELNCAGSIDDIATSKIITLSTNQQIPKTTTFKNLKVTESLTVGNIIGEHASKFLPNPTLLETNFIKSKVQFKNLEVQGSVIISNEFSGKNLERQLQDIIYKNEEKAIIQAMKQFPEGFTVRENLAIISNSINNINLNTIITKNSEQSLDIKEIEGVVTFGNIETTGLYNSVDVKKLDENLVKLFGEQYISATLIFEDELEVNQLEVVETINNLQSDINSIKQQEILEVANIYIEGDLTGNIDNFDLKDFTKNKLSLSQDQLIDNKFIIDELLTEDMLPAKINNLNPQDLMNESWLQKLTSKLLNRNLQINNFYATNSVEIDHINNRPVMNLSGAFWRHDIKKYNITNLSFNDDVTFDNVQIEQLSGVNFGKFLQSVVFKNETEVRLSGQKRFLKGVNVKKLIETEELNNIGLNDILRKHTNQEISSPLTIHGDILFQDNVTVFENIDDIPVKLLKKNYEFNTDYLQINGDVLFNRLAHIKNLQINGFINKNLAQDTLDGLVYTNENQQIHGEIFFQNKVNLDKNIRVVGKINNIDLPAFVSNMVMITKDTTIKTPVKFTNEVMVENQIFINKNLTATYLNDIDINSWIDKAIFVNKGILKGEFLFKNAKVIDKLYIEKLNNINMSSLIPLRVKQKLPNLSLTEVSLFKDVSVGNSTNLHNLTSEFTNTVLINSDQNIESDIEFIGNIFIENDLELSGLLNEIKTQHIVTTNTDQDLEAIYKFKSKINLDKNLEVEGLVNGIDITQWSIESIKILSQNVQNITDDWVINQDLVIQDNSRGQILINNINLKKFSEEIEAKRNHKYQVEKGFIDDYKNLCKDLTFMYDKLKKQIYRFNYLENLQILNLQKSVDFIYYYEYKDNIYLIVNEKKSCDSYLFIFDLRFRYLKDIHLGPIAQIVAVRSEDLLYLVVRNQPFYSTCKVEGTNLWEVQEQDLVHLAVIEDQDLLQESLELNTFYGINHQSVVEFKVLPNNDIHVKKFRKWLVPEENIAFVPRGLATGLALRSGRKLIRLHRESSLSEDLNSEIEEIIIGNFTEEFNTYIPGRKGSDLVVMKVGIKSNKRNLLAIASHEETSVKGNLDFIKIYEDIHRGKVFHKVASYKPSSLVSLEFNNGETLLAFMEDESVLQVYEYKGIEGFKHKLSAKLQGSKLFNININLNKNERKILGVIDKNKITFIDVIMLGNQIEENLNCLL